MGSLGHQIEVAVTHTLTEPRRRGSPETSPKAAAVVSTTCERDWVGAIALSFVALGEGSFAQPISQEIPFRD